MNTRILATCVALSGLAAAPALSAEIWWKPYASDANTLGLWHFDDVTGSTGSFLDSGPGANHGALTDGVVAPVTSGAGAADGIGMFGKSLQRQVGGNSWGSIPDDNADMEPGALANMAMTIEAWIKPSVDDLGTGVYRGIASKRGGGASFNLGLLESKLYIEGNTAGGYWYTVAPSAFAADQWHHVAAVFIENWAGGNGFDEYAFLYVDGVLVAQEGYTQDNGLNGPLVDNNNPLLLGSLENTATYHFRGEIDEMRYSKVAREFAPVPEPAAIGAIAGLMALGLRRRR